MTISTEIKYAMAEALENLPATSNGTEIQDIVLAGDDAFDTYPVIRIVPQGMSREVNAERRYYTYTVNYVISVYLEMGDATIPDEEIIDTLQELSDNIMARLDGTDWLPTVSGYDIYLVENSMTANIDTTQSKTGTALYCDIIYPVSYRKIV